MILQALHRVFDRLQEDPDNYQLPTPGWSNQKIALEIIINPNGSLHAIHNICVPAEKGNKTFPQQLLVPGDSKPSGSGINPCFLWDNTSYALGYKSGEEDNTRSLRSFEAFKEKHLALRSVIKDPQYDTLCTFLETWYPSQLPIDSKNTIDSLASGFVVFRINGKKIFLHELPSVKAYVNTQNSASETQEDDGSMCLISGKKGRIATLHEPAIKGVANAQSSGAKIVTFNADSFTSYGKDQGANAPVSEEAVFRYCNALNALLNSKKHRLTMSGTTCVFWTEKPNPVEDIFAALFGFDSDLNSSETSQDNSNSEVKDSQKPAAQDNPKLQSLRAFLQQIWTGGASALPKKDKDCPYYLLGISPNASRLAIRFWYSNSVGDLANMLKKHQDELALIRGPLDTIPFTIRNLLAQTGREAKDIPPLLEGALTRSIILGTPYPLSFITKIIARIRADQKINSIRTAALKAYLIRNHQYTNLTMSLDTTNTQPAYLLGRLFATLEKIQDNALGTVNAGIRERFYASASATPKVVFSLLIRKAQNHLTKMTSEGKGKLANSRNNLIGEITDHIEAKSGWPAHLSLGDQSLFALGYYQQRQDFYKGKTQEETN